MVAQFSNTESFSLMFNDDFSEEKIQEYEDSLDTLGHIYVHSIDRNNISHENLKKLYERIYLKRKNLKLVLSADNILDVSFYTEKDEPQPQVVVAFGLRITNCAPSKSSL